MWTPVQLHEHRIRSVLRRCCSSYIRALGKNKVRGSRQTKTIHVVFQQQFKTKCQASFLAWHTNILSSLLWPTQPAKTLFRFHPSFNFFLSFPLALLVLNRQNLPAEQTRKLPQMYDIRLLLWCAVRVCTLIRICVCVCVCVCVCACVHAYMHVCSNWNGFDTWHYLIVVTSILDTIWLWWHFHTWHYFIVVTFPHFTLFHCGNISTLDTISFGDISIFDTISYWRQLLLCLCVFLLV